MFCQTAWAQDVLTLGVFAYRPKLVMEKQYQPLADYLGNRLPDHDIRLRVLTQDEMESALDKGELDLVFTNPSHFTQLRLKSNLTGAIATLVVLERGLPVSRLGGVIFKARGNKELRSLEDLRGHRLAIPGSKYLGGFQAQAYDLLQRDIHLPQDVASMEAFGSHDQVVLAVLAGQADAGFIRTGIIEAMIKEGHLDPGRIEVLNPQNFHNFPFAVSTRLYPEWAFAALPHVDERVVRQVARALLEIEHTDPVALAAGIYGFTVPADYLPVENLARALRLPPFDQAPDFTVRDVLSRWSVQVTLLATAIGIILLLMARLFYMNRVIQRQKELERMHLAALGEGVYGIDLEGRCTFINPAALSMLQYSENEVIGHELHQLFNHHRQNGAVYEVADSPFLQTLQDGQVRRFDEWFIRKDGSGFPVSVAVTPFEIGGRKIGAEVAFQDISARKQMEADLTALATTDALTGLANRRHFFSRTLDELARVKRRPDVAASLLLIDLDHFKQVNDRFGHAAGDAVLRQFAALMKSELRETDVAGRVGGEEFTLLLSGATVDDACPRAERLRAAVEASSVDYGTTSIRYTISVGVTALSAGDEDPDAPLARADKALYSSKENGRNRVTAFNPAGESGQ